MAIKVKFVGLPVRMPGEVSVEPERDADLALRSLLDTVLGQHGDPSLVEALFSGGELRSNYFILVNGRNTQQLDGMDTLVQDGSTVVVAAMVAGG